MSQYWKTKSMSWLVFCMMSIAFISVCHAQDLNFTEAKTNPVREKVFDYRELDRPSQPLNAVQLQRALRRQAIKAYWNDSSFDDLQAFKYDLEMYHNVIRKPLWVTSGNDGTQLACEDFDGDEGSCTTCNKDNVVDCEVVVESCLAGNGAAVGWENDDGTVSVGCFDP